MNEPSHPLPSQGIAKKDHKDWSEGLPLQAAAVPKEIDRQDKLKLEAHYDRLASRRGRFRRLNAYYYRELLRNLRRFVPRGKKVLELGCGDGFILRSLEPARGVGVDLSAEMIKQARILYDRAPGDPGPSAGGAGEDSARESVAGGEGGLVFQQGDAETLRLRETFDFVLCSDLLGDLLDIQQALLNLRSACDSGTRVVIHYHGMLWEPWIKLGQRLGLKMPQRHHNWLTRGDIANLLNLCDFDMIVFERRILLPFGIPLLAPFLNRFVASLPLFRGLCLVNFIVARKREKPAADACSASIVIPCRNERGTVRAAVTRLPYFGSSQEILFVDGHSSDGTPEEIEKVMREFPRRNIRLLRQTGKGKGDAVRLGFAQASKDILIILDGDLSVPPEDMPKFFDALAARKGEFINGSRLVYPLEGEAMRFLNILGNHFFSRVLTWLLSQPLKDTLCGTKALFRKDYEKISAGRAQFGDFDPFGDFDLLFGAVRQNLKIVEVPVRYRERVYGATNISRFRHGLLLLKMVAYGCFKLKW